MNFQSFYKTVLLEANPEKRLAYLKGKYEKVLNELMVKHFIIDDSNEKQYYDNFRNIYGKPPIEFIIHSIDPTKGEYSEWIIKHLIKDVSSGDMNDKQLWRFFTEDFFKVYEDLEKYHKYKRLFKKASIDMNNPNTATLTDINRIDGFDELYKMIRVIQPYIDEIEQKESEALVEKDAEKVYTSDNYLVVVPKTQEASCAYGRGTRWCTASTGSYNYFNQYNKQGPLYIIINRKTQEKFQFHFPSEQYMNADDSAINVWEFFEKNPELKEFFLELGIKNDSWNFVSAINYEKLDEKIETLPEESQIKIIQTYIPVAFKYGQKHPEFVNQHQNLMVFESDGTLTLQTDATEWSHLSMFIGIGSRGVSDRRRAEEYYDKVLIKNATEL